MKKIVVIFIDILADKNKLQVNAIDYCGLNAFFFVYNYNERVNDFLGIKNSQNLLKKMWLPHIYQVYQFLNKNKNKIHHLEIYPGGEFSFLYVILGKIFKIKTVCVERGDLLYFHKSGYSVIVRFSMWFCYKFASITWYRELYMKQKLEKIGAKNLFFLHNAVKVENMKNPENGTLKPKKDITFLWLNRVIPERRYEWLIAVLKKKELKKTVNYLVGLVSNSVYIKEQEFIKLNKPENLTLEEYTQVPSDYFRRAKFFILPADVVFANNALLEAMSYGVIPLVSNQPGAELIVEHGKNGFIFQHTYEDFERNIMEAYNLEDDTYSKFSAAARDKIITDFSEKNYIRGIKELYTRLNSLSY